MKIYCASQFFCELDTLELRLEILDPVVDYFIITESNLTWSGIPKPFYYDENKERFKKFWPKIIYQMHTSLPTDYVNLSPDIAKDEMERKVIERVMTGKHWPHEHVPYGRDTYEKESLLMGMKNCELDDMVILSDLDEIPDPATIKYIIENGNLNEIYNFNQRAFYYYFNVEKTSYKELGPIMLSYKNFLNNSFWIWIHYN